MWHASILVRAHATAQRHTCNAHIPFEGVGAALAIGLDSSGSPSALSVTRAHSSDPAALESPRELAQLYASSPPAVAAGRPPPMRWPQRGGPRGCGQRIGGGLRLPQPEEFKHGAIFDIYRKSIEKTAPLDPPYRGRWTPPTNV